MSAVGLKRTCPSRRKMFAFDPKQGFAALIPTYLLDGLLSRLMAQAVYRVAILAGMTKMETAWRACMTFASLFAQRPSGQWAKRFNWTAAEASYILRHVIEHMKTANTVFFII